MALPDPSFFDSWQAYAQALNTELGKVYGVSGEDTVNQSEYEDPQLGSNILSEDGLYVINDNYVNNSLVPVGGNILPDWNFELTAAAGFGTSFSGDFWEESTSGVTVDTSGENSSRALSFDVAGGVARSTLNFPVTAGEVMYFSWKHFRPTSYTGNLTLQVRRLDSSGTLIGTTTISQNAGSENTWNTTSVEYTVPTGTFSLTVEVTASSISPSAPSVNWIWVSRTEYRATVGATVGTDLVDENGNVLGSENIGNDYLVNEFIGGSVIGNGSFHSAVVDSNGALRPSSWYRRIGTGTDLGAAFPYVSESTRDYLQIIAGHTASLSSEAFRTNTETEYELVVRARRTAGTGNLAWYQIAKTSDLAEGKESLSSLSTGVYDTEIDTGGTVRTSGSLSVTGTFSVFVADIIPGASDEWTSISFRTSATGQTFELDYAFLREKSTRNTGDLADLDSIDTANVTVGALSVFSRADQGNTTISTATTWTDIGSMTVDVGSDPSNVVAMVTFYPSDGQRRDSRTSGGYLTSMLFGVEVDSTRLDTVLMAFAGPTVYGSETRCFNTSPISFLIDGGDLDSGDNTFVFQANSPNTTNFTSYSTGNASYMTVEIFKRT